jgi:hypothetical protein
MSCIKSYHHFLLSLLLISSCNILNEEVPIPEDQPTTETSQNCDSSNIDLPQFLVGKWIHENAITVELYHGSVYEYRKTILNFDEELITFKDTVYRLGLRDGDTSSLDWFSVIGEVQMTDYKSERPETICGENYSDWFFESGCLLGLMDVCEDSYYDPKFSYYNTNSTYPLTGHELGFFSNGDGPDHYIIKNASEDSIGLANCMGGRMFAKLVIE